MTESSMVRQPHTLFESVAAFKLLLNFVNICEINTQDHISLDLSKIIDSCFYDFGIIWHTITCFLMDHRVPVVSLL